MLTILKKVVASRLWPWLFFNVAVALLPFGASAIYGTIQTNSNIDIGSNFFNRREFFLIIVSIASENIGDIIINGKNLDRFVQGLLGGISLALVILSAFLFAMVTSLPDNHSEALLFNWIISMFVTVLCVGVICKIIITESL